MKNKTILKLGALVLGIVLLTGCTKSFCTVQDKVNMMYNYENIKNDKDQTNLDIIIETVNSKGNYYAPSEAFFDYIEMKVLEVAVEAYKYTKISIDDNPDNDKLLGELTDVELADENNSYRIAFTGSDEYNLIKYAKENTTSNNSLWSNYDLWRKEAVNEGLTYEDLGSDYYHTYMKEKYASYVNGITACITPEDITVNDGTSDLRLEGISWGKAFEYGLIEGLLVWPISSLLFLLNNLFTGMGVWGTILAILIVTVVVRGLLLLLTFKQTASQQKMTELQPELARIQAKYPNADTNQYQKQQMAQEQMALYKKYNINPFSMFIVLIFQFPIFIAVWGAMSGSAVLRSGDLFGLSLSAATGSTILEMNGTKSVVALIIFLLMAIMQAVSMFLPQYLQKKRTQNVAKLNKNPTQEKNQGQMKIMNIIMFAMIVIMGFSLPVAMAIYWIITAIISLTQSLVMSSISNKNLEKKNEFKKYKTKK